MKNLILALFTFSMVFYGCKGNGGAELAPDAPTINDIVFTTQTNAEVYVSSDADAVEVTYTDQNGQENSVESSADPVEVAVPFGNILEFKARGKNDLASEPGAYSSAVKVLASVNEDDEVNRLDFMEVINEMRGEGFDCGGTQMSAVPKLLWDDQLELLSTSHAQDMFDNDFVDGTGSDGKTYGQRIKEVFTTCQSYRELLGGGATSADAMMQLWQNSPGSCAVIMQSNMRYMSVAKKGNKWVFDLRE